MKDPSTLMRTPATGPPPRAGVRPPVVERIAGWSARHRNIALFGWLLLVAGAVVIGSMLGTKNLNSYDPGQAGQAERVLSRPGVVQPHAESVLIQARDGRHRGQRPADPPAIRQVTVALQRMPGVATDIQSPLAPGGTAWRGRPRADLAGRPVRPGHVRGRGQPEQRHQIVPRRARGGRGRRPPTPACGSPRPASASVDRATNNIVELGLPARRGHLGADHAGAAAGGVRRADRGGHPAAARRHRGGHRHLAARHPQPLAADRQHHILGGAAGRHGRGHRLLAVLPAPGTGGTGRGRQPGRGATDRGGDLWTRHRGVRADRDDLPGRAVPDRHRRFLPASRWARSSWSASPSSAR